MTLSDWGVDAFGENGEFLLEEAEKHLREAIEICESINYPAHHAFRGSLAFVTTILGDIEQARSLIEYSDNKLLSVPSENGKFLCKKAKVLHIVKQSDKATKALKQAKSIAKELNAKPDSELQKAIIEAEQFLSSPPGGTPPSDTGSSEEREQ